MYIVPIALLLTFVQLEEDKTTKTRCPFFIFHDPTSFGVTPKEVVLWKIKKINKNETAHLHIQTLSV